MTKPVLHDRIIFRVPRFSYKDRLPEHWEVLKELIGYSSPDFFELISNRTAADLAAADPKIQITVRKYFNRAAFRSTPYGAFSAVGVTSLSWKDHEVQLGKDIRLHSFTDWSYTEPSQQMQLEKAVLFANTTFYRVKDEIRYVQKAQHEFQVAVMDYDLLIWQILEFYCVPQTLDQLTDRFPDLDKQALTDLLADLVEHQLLFTSNHPNIIGEDFFSRTGYHPNNADKQYLIAEREPATGSIDKALFRHLPELVLCLQKISGVTLSTDLLTFRNNFLRRYGQAEVSLLEVLDPETGIGYGSFTNHVTRAPITRLAAVGQAKPGNDKLDQLRKRLYAQILKCVTSGEPIALEALILEDADNSVLPNSISALCQVSDGDVWLEFLGGASATAISGRFALAIPEIKDHCKMIADHEQRANPSVLFFDIGYTKEIAVDNINRRPAIFEWQLNILNYDTSARPLCVNDILVSVHGDQVVIRSKSMNKRLIPRMTTAYNHKRSDLSLLRLLMDIQYQGIAVDLMPHLTDLVPGLSHYPRVQFRNLIVSPAMWKIQNSVVKEIAGWVAKQDALKAHLKAIVASRYIKAGYADQTLCLDTTDDQDIELLLSLLQKKEEIYVEEAKLPDTPIVLDHHQNPCMPQFVLTLTTNEEIYKPIAQPTAEEFNTERQSWVLPGKEWLYFEIYCNPFRSDTLLNEKISHFIEANKSRLRSWFFIRYTEGGNHIRLRLKLIDPREGYIIMGDLSDCLREEIDSGLISELKLKIYQKEIQRYTAAMMDKVEDHFHQDSQFVFSMLGTMLTDAAKYKLCVDVLEAIAATDALPGDKYVGNALRMADYLKAEHQANAADFKEINQLYRSFLNESFPPLTGRSLRLHQLMIDSFVETLRAYDTRLRPQILADLIHMHINRLFVTDQRLHELIIYNFYLLQHKSRQRRSRQETGR